MISLIVNLFSWHQKKKDQLNEKFEKELENFNKEFKETGKTLSTLRMQNVLDFSQELNRQNIIYKKNLKNIETDECFERVGIVTKLSNDYGLIDKHIYFENSVVCNVGSALTVGCTVTYLVYKNSKTDYIKVLKVTILNQNDWDVDEESIEKDIPEKLLNLQSTESKYFTTHQRNILGFIISCNGNSIIIDIDYKHLNVPLDSVDFIPKEGDRVYCHCKVQTDENFIDKQGEVLEVVNVCPARVVQNEKCTITKIFEDGGELSQHFYFTNDVLPSAYKPKVGDAILADLIECERANYVLRCIKFSIVEENQNSLPLQNQKQNENHSVYVGPDATCIFNCTFSKQIVDIVLKNNTNRVYRCINIQFRKSHGNFLINLVDSKLNYGFVLNASEERIIQFEIEPSAYGEFFERITFIFENLRITRRITAIVCESVAEAETLKQSITQEKVADENICIPLVNYRNKNRVYAYQIFTEKNNVIPGLRLTQNRRFIRYRFPEFQVPEVLKNAYLLSSDRSEMISNIDKLYPCLTQDLSIENYVNRFQTLVFLEEIETFLNFRHYDMDYAYFTREGEYLALKIENLAERRPSLIIGDTVRTINPWDNNTEKCSYEGVIYKVLFDRILLKFNPNFHNTYNGQSCRLEFHFSRFPFRKQHAAIERVVKNLGESFLFPNNVQKRRQLQLNIKLDEEANQLILCDTNTECPWYNTQLNIIQKKAIVNILRGEVFNIPYIIFGPPGTGKTMTVVETILQLVKLLPNSRLLVGAPSNSSADLIITRLIASNVLEIGDFIRLVAYNQIERELIPEHLAPYCVTADIAVEGTCSDGMITTESGLRLKCQMRYLGRHRVTISTCTTLGTFMQMDFPKGHFTHVIIDECGQCTEPEAMIPINQVSKAKGQIILAGDPRQLQAHVLNSYAFQRGSLTSFLERIIMCAPYARDVVRFPHTYGYDPRLITKLIYNYRALPSILYVYNTLFYDSELLPMIDDKNSREAEMLLALDSILPESSKRSKSHAVFFYGILSENMQMSDSPSWYNPQEAKSVFLKTLELYRKAIKPHNIGIIAPYAKQVKHIRTLFITADVPMPKIGSVEEFQGQERDIILISMVRSTKKYISNDLRHSLGFIQCPKRMNVAISRARCLVYIFGNPHVLLLDEKWRELIKYCVNNDAYDGCDLPDDFSTNTIQTE